ncbi:ABC transporter ATP-binding protein [Hyphomonas jannaschiana]|uniref:Putative multidrug ABC transporter permease/ATP-binding protein n=1 Tax=Hyphomonas jannaschiana VP2 TaxID=1280952 RepID=A0A059F6M0_9PROT|nr:ABC transporter ATP-binding protein [Hyphomonas jannaschiana]KCZ82826.1 putative multidrug ABC transporter permease/ATP-binding protein [Hyphomonas jannaschiana VP2]
MFRFFERRLSPFPDSSLDVPPQGFWPFVWYYVRDAVPWLAGTAILTAIIAVGEVTLFGFLGGIVDWLSSADRDGFLQREGLRLAVMAGVVLVALPLATLIHALIVYQGLMGNVPMSARWRMHRQMLGQSMNFFGNEFAGRVATKVMQTALAVREAVMKILDVFVFVIVYFVSALVLVASSDWRLMLPFLLWGGLYCLVMAWFVPRLGKVAEEQADARSVMTGRIVDSYTNIQTVKLFAHAGHEEAYAKDSMQGFLQTVYRQMRYVTGFNFIVYLNNSLLVFLVGAVGIYLWMGNLIGAGAVAAAIGLTLRIKSMSQWIMWEVAGLFENIGVVYDGKSMLNRPVAVSDAPDAEDLPRGEGAIEFRNVGFHYGKGSGVIEDFSLSIRPGEKIGLVGRSGAGKTTLTNLLLRFYETESGAVLLDGHDVSHVTQDSLRAQIGVVTQDTSLLHRSIRENIAYGRPGASDAEILTACEKAAAMDFINELEDSKGRRGLDAHVGERGVKLSGGQRQRIAIARIFLKDAPVLILDEATSALDSEVEAVIQEKLFELMEGKTVIAIAHRLSTIAAMDRLIVLDKGKIVEQGSHAELVAAGGLYSELWARQSGGFLVEPDETDSDVAAE